MPRLPSPGSLRDSADWEVSVRVDDGRGGQTVEWQPATAEPVLCRVIARSPVSLIDYSQEARIASHSVLQRPIRGLVPGSARATVTESNGRTFTAELLAARDLGAIREWQELDVREIGPGSSPS